MAISKMHHFKLYSLKSLTDPLLSFLQDYGPVHIRDLSEEADLLESGLDYVSEPRDILDVTAEMEDIEASIDFLSQYEEPLGALESMKRGKKNYSYGQLMEEGQALSVAETCQELKKLKEYLEENDSKIDALQAGIEDLKPWKGLKMSSEDLTSTRRIKLITGYMLNPNFDNFKEDLNELDYSHAQKLTQDDKNTFMVVVTLKGEWPQLKELLRKYSFFYEEVHCEKGPIEEIQEKEKQIQNIQAGIKGIEKNIRAHLPALDHLKLRYEYLSQIHNKMATNDRLLGTQKVNLIEGYIESDRVEDFKGRLEDQFHSDIYLEIEPADPADEEVPIVLKNNKFVAAFENVTLMYAVPKYNEIDPTPFLAPFYWLFFGMMIGDAGYGLLLILGTRLALSFNLDESKRKNITFFYYLGFSALLWGLIYGSIFGGIVPMPQLINPESDYMAIMIVSIILGGLHMFMGLGLSAYMKTKNQSFKDALYDVFTWYVTLAGAIYFLLASPLGLPGGRIAMAVMVLGMLGILVFTGREAESTAGRLATGAYNLYGITSWVGDFISYLRVMALGLSGAFIGLAVNMIAGMLASGGIAGIIAAVIVFILGQVMNIALSALSGYVHSLRLIFVEFFGKFYEGGGKPFESMRKQTKYINIKK
ncbi:MAG: V-type ATP synthase subunit I [Tissierellia bacterium]|nr:V-type ATP synthase subunit I [Tissierellia bacterium]